MKNTTYYWTGERSVKAPELPEGYFYKGKFYTESACFKALLVDDEVRVYRFPKGTWEYLGIWFPSLKDLYEDFEGGELNMPYEELKSRYNEIGIEHNPNPCTMYQWLSDDESRLYYTKGAVLEEMRYNGYLIKSAEDVEEEYIEDLSEADFISYLKKPIKEKIRILEEFKQ